MLVYHPAFDIYNCVYRMLRILTYMKQESVELDRIRIWDFYLTFPNEARKIKFPRDLSDLKRVFKQKVDNPYEDLIDPRRIIDRMKSYQISALKCIASYGLIDSEELSRNVVKRSSKEIPQKLINSFDNGNIEEMNILKLIVGFNELPLYGSQGLKYRTGLIDFKYDPR